MEIRVCPSAIDWFWMMLSVLAVGADKHPVASTDRISRSTSAQFLNKLIFQNMDTC
uniref:Uncharacterized protein n=1 Tax=Arundo donax TaxID=35708 RepID=A0A0A9HHW5_ARUDO